MILGKIINFEVSMMEKNYLQVSARDLKDKSDFF
jgi:hypothetical protein